MNRKLQYLYFIAISLQTSEHTFHNAFKSVSSDHTDELVVFCSKPKTSEVDSPKSLFFGLFRNMTEETSTYVYMDWFMSIDLDTFDSTDMPTSVSGVDPTSFSKETLATAKLYTTPIKKEANHELWQVFNFDIGNLKVQFQEKLDAEGNGIKTEGADNSTLVNWNNLDVVQFDNTKCFISNMTDFTEDHYLKLVELVEKVSFGLELRNYIVIDTC